MSPENFALFGANTIILAVFAGAFAIAGAGRPQERHWRWWFAANTVLALALVGYGVAPLFPWAANVPDVMLVAGFALRWQAARAFAGRTTPWEIIGASVAALFLLAAIPYALSLHGLVYAAVNLVLTVLALASALEFWRVRCDGLPSRLALIGAYVLIAVSFAARIGQGVAGATDFAPGLQDDPMLTAHLIVGLLHTAGAGAFALSLAYERSAAELQRAASRDALTGLLNRGAFEKEVQRLLDGSPPRPFALVFFDIDHFKSINDRFGHAAGDEALRICADILRCNLRAGDVAARIGGEEFAVVLTDTDIGGACAVADRIRNEIAAAVVRSGRHAFSTTVSAGVSHSGMSPRDYDSLMRRADGGLYRAKAGGRDRVEAAA